VIVRLTQIDGVLPNLALMKLSHWHKAQGHEVVFKRSVEKADEGHLSRDFFEPEYDVVYGSAIFKFSQVRLLKFMRQFPGAIVGGTGTPKPLDFSVEGAVIGREYEHYDYSLYPDVDYSIGFTQRGCRLKCGFCVVSAKEGKPRGVNTISQIYRGDPFPRHLHILDNDFFFDREWSAARLDEIRAGGFKVALTQGINCRMIDDEAAAGIASIDYRSDDFKTKRLYTAWDSLHDEKRLLRGLELLAKHGVKPDHIMVYMLIGYREGETDADWLHRQSTLRAFGARPYPMPFVRTPETVGFQRWVNGAYDKRVPWERFKAAKYQPANLGDVSSHELEGEVA
jgi:hypothetical protein